MTFLFIPLPGIPSGIVPSAYNTIQNAGTPLTQRQTLNMTGSGVSCADSGGITVCTFSAGGGTQRGVFASAATCNSSFSGGVYYATDVPLIGECNGTAYQWFAYGEQAVTLPSATSFSSLNLGSGSITTNGVMTLSIPDGSGDNLRGQYIATPSTPFTIDACFKTPNLIVGTSVNYGVFQSDGTKLQTFNAQTSGGAIGELTVGNWNSVTSFNAAQIAAQSFRQALGSPVCLRWNDNGTNITVFWTDDGFTWLVFGTFSRTSFTSSPTEMGWYMDNNQTTITSNFALTLYHWLQH